MRRHRCECSFVLLKGQKFGGAFRRFSENWRQNSLVKALKFGRFAFALSFRTAHSLPAESLPETVGQTRVMATAHLETRFDQVERMHQTHLDHSWAIWGKGA